MAVDRRGAAQSEVTLESGGNGRRKVADTDRATNKDQKITITSSSGLSKDEVERMAKEAEAHAAEDKSRREEIEARNQLDGLVYNVEKMLKEHGDKISGDDKGSVESALADAKKALDNTSADAAVMNSARERLTQASHKLAEAMYKAAQPQGSTSGAPGAGTEAGAAPGAGQQKKDEGVIDAEYVDVDEKK